jgi:hypothetical protein
MPKSSRKLDFRRGGEDDGNCSDRSSGSNNRGQIIGSFGAQAKGTEVRCVIKHMTKRRLRKHRANS